MEAARNVLFFLIAFLIIVFLSVSVYRMVDPPERQDICVTISSEGTTTTDCEH